MLSECGYCGAVMSGAILTTSYGEVHPGCQLERDSVYKDCTNCRKQFYSWRDICDLCLEIREQSEAAFLARGMVQRKLRSRLKGGTSA